MLSTVHEILGTPGTVAKDPALHARIGLCDLPRLNVLLGRLFCRALSCAAATHGFVTFPRRARDFPVRPTAGHHRRKSTFLGPWNGDGARDVCAGSAGLVVVAGNTA